MKKPNRKRALVLQTETLNQLTPEELRQAVGGAGPDGGKNTHSCYGSCGVTYTCNCVGP